jgi:hypothetical protein
MLGAWSVEVARCMGRSGHAGRSHVWLLKPRPAVSPAGRGAHYGIGRAGLCDSQQKKRGAEMSHSRSGTGSGGFLCQSLLDGAANCQFTPVLNPDKLAL